MTDYFTITRFVAVGDAVKTSIEQMGSKPKFWLNMVSTGKRWLFKSGRQTTGEDWAEKVAAEVAGLLGLPHAQYELAVFSGRQGVISLDFTDRGARGSLVHGNELLSAAGRSYPKADKYGVTQHTIDNILSAIAGAALPSTPLPTGVEEAGDLFLGYLLLDALTGNTDRHHENWGLLVNTPAGAEAHRELAPTFDHASSLGRELTDEARTSFLTGASGRSVGVYARRGMSAIYASSDDRRPLPTLDAFLSLAKLLPRAYAGWKGKLKSIADHALVDIVERVPQEFISQPARSFAGSLLVYNRHRILETEP